LRTCPPQEDILHYFGFLYHTDYVHLSGVFWTVKKDYRELILFLEESSNHETEEGYPYPADTPSEPESENLELQQFACEVQKLQETVSKMQEDIRSMGGDIGNQIVKIETHLKKETQRHYPANRKHEERY